MDSSKVFSRARLGYLFLFLMPVSTANAALISDLLITEVMANPQSVSDSNGEWFELFNPTNETFDLSGIYIADDGSDKHQIDIGSSLLILPNQYLVFARNGDSATNGGFTADYVYSNFLLGNSGDEILFSDDITEFIRFGYGSTFDSPGTSRELVNIGSGESGYDLTLASLTYGGGDIGTPGFAGSVNFETSTVPTPPTLLLFVLGLAGFYRPFKRAIPTA
jgi:hypothetical protein